MQLKLVLHTTLFLILIVFSSQVLAAGGTLGTFKATGKLSWLDQTVYTEGCKMPPLPFGQSQIDGRIKKGLTFETVERSVNGKAKEGWITRKSVVTAVSDEVLDSQETVTKAENVTGLKTGFKTAKHCELIEGELACTYKPFYPAYETEKDYSGCGGGGGALPKIEKYVGKYTLASGKVVNAFQMITKISMGMNCDGKDMGEAEMIMNDIVSNDIPSYESANYCGGVKIYSGIETRLKNGEFIQADSTELTSIK